MRCIACYAETDGVTGPMCARCNRLRSLPEDWGPPMAAGNRPDDDPYVDDALDLGTGR